jgi:prophage antirepressor-like protein
MIEEIKTDNNCIVKAFENNPISILHEDINNKKVYYFKASDVGNALGIVNIRTTIQNYEDDDERVVRKVYDPHGTLQDTIFLTSQGVYRLLYNSKKEIAKKFRKWAGNILDDIIFNESKELKRQLEEQQNVIEEQKTLVEEQKTMIKEKEKLLLEQNKEINKYKEKIYEEVEKRGFVYVIKTDSYNFYKVGKTKDFVLNRVKGLQTGNVNDIQILLEFQTSNPDLLEKNVHYILDRYRCNSGREFFECNFEYIQKIIEICGNTIDTLKSTYQNIFNSQSINSIDKEIFINIDKFSTLQNTPSRDQDQQLLKDNQFYQWLDKNVILQKGSVLRLKDVVSLYAGRKLHPKAASILRLELEMYIKNKYTSIKSEYSDSSFNGERYKGWLNVSLSNFM